MKAEGLNVLVERTKALDPEQNNKFLGCEQAEQIDTTVVFKRVEAEI